MAKGSSRSEPSSAAGRPLPAGTRGTPAAAAAMRRRTVGGISSGRGSSGRSVGGGGDMLLRRLYTDDAPGLKLSPITVVVMSFSFIVLVVALHVLGKFYRASAGGQ